MRTVLIEGVNMPYVFKKRPRSKRIRISVSHKSALLVTAPRWVPNFFIEQAMKERRRWILSALAQKQRYKEFKEQARELVLRRLDYFNRHYGFLWNTVSIRNQKTRWGSCSKKKNLNFHFKLALVPEHLADYVVVHELCHLEEFNHSKKFWDLVARAIPDYKTRRKELRGHQNAINKKTPH